MRCTVIGREKKRNKKFTFYINNSRLQVIRLTMDNNNYFVIKQDDESYSRRRSREEEGGGGRRRKKTKESMAATCMSGM